MDCEKVSSSFSLDSQGSGVEEGPEEGELREGAPGDSRSFPKVAEWRPSVSEAIRSGQEARGRTAALLPKGVSGEFRKCPSGLAAFVGNSRRSTKLEALEVPGTGVKQCTHSQVHLSDRRVLSTHTVPSIGWPCWKEVAEEGDLGGGVSGARLVRKSDRGVPRTHEGPSLAEGFRRAPNG